MLWISDTNQDENVVSTTTVDERIILNEALNGA
jgi:hypothetical protein